MITVRRANLKDIPQLIDMIRDFIHHGETLVKKEHEDDLVFIKKRSDAVDKIRDYFRRCIHSRNATIFVAEHKDTIVGYTLITIKKNIPIFKMEWLGYVSDLYIREKYRGLGASTLLKDEAFSWFKEKGITHTSIIVDPFNYRALTIYKKWGFNEFFLELRTKIE